MTIELAGQIATIAAVISFGIWNDRRIARLFREIGDRLDVIDARLALGSEAQRRGPSRQRHANARQFRGKTELRKQRSPAR